MAYLVQSRLKESALCVVVETVRDVISKVAELTEQGHVSITVRDMHGDVIDPSVLGLDEAQK